MIRGGAETFNVSAPPLSLLKWVGTRLSATGVHTVFHVKHGRALWLSMMCGELKGVAGGT